MKPKPKLFRIDDRVRYKSLYAPLRSLHNKVGTVIGFDRPLLLVRFEDWRGGHGGHTLSETYVGERKPYSSNARDCFWCIPQNLERLPKEKPWKHSN